LLADTGWGFGSAPAGEGGKLGAENLLAATGVGWLPGIGAENLLAATGVGWLPGIGAEGTRFAAGEDWGSLFGGTGTGWLFATGTVLERGV
jgi:hypothetical protein